jgi:methionyl-tRNA synthetase
MTRDLDWGVPVPLPDTTGKVLYVWFEAPIGYISATKELRPNDWQDWWKGDTRLVHFIGKDNIVFHCIIFPAMLHLRGEGYVVPEQVPANEFLNLEGQKISTSRNWAVWLNEYLQELPGKQDELRYVLCSIAPETKDSEFTWKDYQARVNNELVAILGNFANRVMVLSHKFYGGSVPALKPCSFDEQIAGVRAEMASLLKEMRQQLDEFKFRDGLSTLMNMARAGNRFLAETEPWKLIKTDELATASVMAFSLELLGNIALACEPFLPFTHEKLCRQLNLLPLEYLVTDFWQNGKLLTALPENHSLSEPFLIFNKIEDELIEAQLQKLNQSKMNNEAIANNEEEQTTQKPEITYDDFSRLELMTATIVQAEKVEKADKLLKLLLNTGKEERVVLSGIAQHYSPDEVVGRQVLLLANLAPRKIRGIESRGMILMAEDAQGRLVFVSPSESVDPGSSVS